MSFCPNQLCKNYGRIPQEWPNQLYNRNKFEEKGTQRFICKACGRTFSSMPPKEYEKRIKIAILRFVVAGKSLEDICNALCLSKVLLDKHVENITKILQEFEKMGLGETGFHPQTLYLSILGNIFLITECCGIGYLTEIRPIVVEDNKSYSISTNEWLNKRLSPRRQTINDLLLCDSIVLQNILEIYRVWFNFTVKDYNGQTAAMKVGLSEKPIKLSDLL